jgi:hypothetical protein
MRDCLLERRATKGLIASLAPPFDGLVVEAGPGEMMGDDFRRGRSALGLVAQDFGGAAVQRLTAALEQAVICRFLDQRVLEAIGCLLGWRRRRRCEGGRRDLGGRQGIQRGDRVEKLPPMPDNYHAEVFEIIGGQAK